MRNIRLLLTLAVITLIAGAFVPAVRAQSKGPDPVGLRPDAPKYALHGPFWVGYREFQAKTDFHPTTIGIWYPALNPQGAPETMTYHQTDNQAGLDLLDLGHALENAPPQTTGGPYPLIIFSGGYGTLQHLFSHLTEHFASYGFVVLSIDYSDSVARSASAGIDPDSALYTRPKDISWQINYAGQLMSTGGTLEGLIDINRIAVVGHSAGAYAAEIAGGARLDLSSPSSWCAQYPDLTLAAEQNDNRPLHVICNSLKEKLSTIAGLDAVPQGLWPSWGDVRVNAIVPLAPDVSLMGADSLKNVTIPTMMLSGSKDRYEFSAQPLYQHYLYDNLGSTTKAFVSFENGDHYIFTAKCESIPWMINNFHQYLYCTDPVWDIDRANDLTNHFVTAFLLDTLKGDKDAHKALLPDAVTFPGIDYKTTMK